MSDEGLPEGLYEALHTHAMQRRLAAVPLSPRFEAVDAAEAPHILARHIAESARRRLAEEPEGGRVALVNRLLAALDDPGSQLEAQLEQLIALTGTGPGAREWPRPTTPLSTSALLTNAAEEPSLGAELRSELASADAVDLLCAFIKWHGLRVLERQLSQLRDRGVPLRVITTTYIGATERRALDELVNRYGAEVRISYEDRSTRLHAKAWLIRRNSGFHTAYIGSSNLSKSALVDGLEWNVRISQVATPELIRKFDATFASYWADPSFEPYDPSRDGARLDAALQQAGGASGSGFALAGLTVRPYPHQDQILEALETEREVHDRHRNLVVAATGTGKTVVAALDYARLCPPGQPRPRLLFVAHRKEILTQSLRTYREVLADGAFGELLVGGERPRDWQHVFASVQSLSALGVAGLDPDRFDVVVVDEFHHAEAATYRVLLQHLRPKELVGLTATPERADGLNVADFFDGRMAFELRLWDALSEDLLVPFHYFGVADGVDLTGIEWKRGAYDVAGLDTLYTGNDARAAKVLHEVRDKVTDPLRMRALGFCVSVAHAEYMAEKFRRAGIPARAVSGATASDERRRALADLAQGRVNALFAADLFNEGVDVPSIDTVLFLRPTQSSTVFLQQLGRGLRRAPGKAVLTALDFIGQHRREFRFDVRYRALTGASRAALARQAETGFPFLPSGSQIVLDRVAQQIVVENIRAQISPSQPALVAEIRSYGDIPLTRFLAESGRALADIYGKRRSWTALRRLAGLPAAEPGPDESALLQSIRTLVHVDDPQRADLYRSLVSPDAPPYSGLSPREQVFARMLFFTLWPNRGGFGSYQEGLEHLRRHPAVCAEIAELLEHSVDAARLSPKPLGSGLLGVPLFSHARYRREEILAALGWATWARRPRGQATGVAWAEQTATDALLINLRKSETDFSPTTMYRDYAISPDLFHWESQNSTALASATGQRYLNHRARGTNVVLFARESPKGELGANPFVCLGQADYVQHQGERPIAITWRLHRAMPAEMYSLASVVAR